MSSRQAQLMVNTSQSLGRVCMTAIETKVLLVFKLKKPRQRPFHEPSFILYCQLLVQCPLLVKLLQYILVGCRAMKWKTWLNHIFFFQCKRIVYKVQYIRVFQPCAHHPNHFSKCLIIILKSMSGDNEFRTLNYYYPQLKES